jgi:serine/threonine protein phosphatase PrpC
MDETEIFSSELEKSKVREELRKKYKMLKIRKKAKSLNFKSSKQTVINEEEEEVFESSTRKIGINWAVRTRKGRNPTIAKKENQDSYISIEQFMDRENFHLFAVFDGHGTLKIYSLGKFGELVSQFCATRLPGLLAKYIKSNEAKKAENRRPLEEVIFFSIQSLVKQLEKSRLETSLSGTTCILCLIEGDLIYVTNIGDSRAIIGQTPKSKKLSKFRWSERNQSQSIEF